MEYIKMDQSNKFMNVWLNKHSKQGVHLKTDRIDDISNKNYIFDLIYNSATASAFINQYDDLNLERKLMDEIDVDQKLQAIMKRVIEQELWKNRHDTKIKYFDNTYRIGDIVRVTYFPESQKYIEYYEDQSFTGRIIFIDNTNVFFVVVDEFDKNNITVKSLEREGCHYFGMTPGYSYIIEQIK